MPVAAASPPKRSAFAKSTSSTCACATRVTKSRPTTVVERLSNGKRSHALEPPIGRPRPAPRRADAVPFVSTSSSTGPSCVTADRRTDARSESPTRPALVITAVAITTPDDDQHRLAAPLHGVAEGEGTQVGLRDHEVHERQRARDRRPRRAPTRSSAQTTCSDTIRPSRNSIRRSARSASATSWVTRIKVVPAVVELVEEVEHLRRRGGVEVAGRLVGPHDARALHERARRSRPVVALRPTAHRDSERAGGPSRPVRARRAPPPAPRRGAVPPSVIGSATFSSAVYTGSRFDDWNTKPMTCAR